MTTVKARTATATRSAGYEIVTEAGGEEYHTVVEKVEDADEPTVTAVDRWKINEAGEKAALDADVTDAVEEALADRGVTVA